MKLPYEVQRAVEAWNSSRVMPTGSRETLEHFGLIEFSGEAWVPTERGKEAGLKTEERA